MLFITIFHLIKGGSSTKDLSKMKPLVIRQESGHVTEFSFLRLSSKPNFKGIIFFNII